MHHQHSACHARAEARGYRRRDPRRRPGGRRLSREEGSCRTAAARGARHGGRAARTCPSRWSWSARPRAPRTSRSARASRASSRRWTSAKARSCARASCSTGSTASRSRRSLAQREGRPGDRGGAAREGQQRRQRATRRWSPSRPSASRSSTTRVAAQDAARVAGGGARKAAVEKATLDLGYTRVTSPIDGLVGTTLVKPGNLVGRGESTLLTTISQIDPILFRVGVTEADYLRVAQARSDASRRRRAASSPASS